MSVFSRGSVLWNCITRKAASKYLIIQFGFALDIKAHVDIGLSRYIYSVNMGPAVPLQKWFLNHATISQFPPTWKLRGSALKAIIG